MLFKDQLGRVVSLETIPKRIISIVPSQTELLFDLGLTEEVVGITKFCVHPEEWFRSKPRVGGTKKLDIEKIQSLKPDLIIGNKEENEQSQVEELMKDYPVWMSDIKTLGDAKRMILAVAELVGKYFIAVRLLNAIDKKFDWLTCNINSRSEKRNVLTVAYLIWNEPMMVAGKDTFINEMILKCGLSNSIKNAINRYPTIDNDIINTLKPDFLFLSSEPFPFKGKHVAEYKTRFPSSKPLLVDGEMFSWYGSRLLKAPDYFHNLLKGIF